LAVALATAIYHFFFGKTKNVEEIFIKVKEMIYGTSITALIALVVRDFKLKRLKNHGPMDEEGGYWIFGILAVIVTSIYYIGGYTNLAPEIRNVEQIILYITFGLSVLAGMLHPKFSVVFNLVVSFLFLTLLNLFMGAWYGALDEYFYVFIALSIATVISILLRFIFLTTWSELEINLPKKKKVVPATEPAAKPAEQEK
jgi:hypothetical protein